VALPDLSYLLAEIGLGLVLLYIPYTAVLILRLPRRGGLVEAMARVVLVPGKRRTWFLVLSTEGALFVLSGLIWQLSRLGVVAPAGATVAAPALYIGAILALMGVQWIGLRPSPLTDAEKVEARAAVPLVFDSLAMAPFAPFSELHDARDDPRTT
jgi:hypothetical protein